MSEKTSLLPTAPADFIAGSPPPSQQQAGADQPHAAINMPYRIVLMPGLEFDPARKYRYGINALAAAACVFVAFLLVEFRNCNGGPGIDLNKLQALHISLMVFAFVLYLLSLFGIADFIFQYKIMFLVGVVTVYTFVGLMCWMTYEAAMNPCVPSPFGVPVDFTAWKQKNVFAKGDAVGIVVLLLDIFATILMFAAAGSFYKRY